VSAPGPDLSQLPTAPSRGAIIDTLARLREFYIARLAREGHNDASNVATDPFGNAVCAGDSGSHSPAAGGVEGMRAA